MWKCWIFWCKGNIVENLEGLTCHLESRVHPGGCDWKQMGSQPIWPWRRRCDWWHPQSRWTFESSLSSPERTGHCATVLKNEQNHSLRCGSKWKNKKWNSENLGCETFSGLFYNTRAWNRFLDTCHHKTELRSWLQPELASSCNLWSARSLKVCATLSFTLIYI